MVDLLDHLDLIHGLTAFLLLIAAVGLSRTWKSITFFSVSILVVSEILRLLSYSLPDPHTVRVVANLATLVSVIAVIASVFFRLWGADLKGNYRVVVPVGVSGIIIGICNFVLPPLPSSVLLLSPDLQLSWILFTGRLVALGISVYLAVECHRDIWSRSILRRQRDAIVGLLVAVLVFGTMVAWYLGSAAHQRGLLELHTRGGIFSAALDKDLVRKVRQAEGDVNDLSYQELVRHLRLVRDANHDVRFVYALREKPPGRGVCLADAEDPSSAEYSPPGAEVPPPLSKVDDFIAAYSGPVVVSDAWLCPWGMWITVTAPVLLDKPGIVVCMDLDAGPWHRSIYRQSLLGIGLMALTGVIVLLLGRSWAYSRQETLTATNRVREREAQLLATVHQASMGRMATFVAHQANAPLAAIHDLLGVIHSGSPEQSENALVVVRSQLGRLTRTIRNLLTYTRQRVSLRHPVSLRDVIATVASIFEPAFQKRGIHLCIIMSDDLPMVEGDADLFQEVLVNLLENARDVLCAGKQVDLSVRRIGTMVEIKVCDDGPGLGDNTERVFTPFFTTKAQGTGLGLSIVRQICSDHGGSVQAFNRHPQGAEFILLLPINVPINPPTKFDAVMGQKSADSEVLGSKVAGKEPEVYAHTDRG